MGICPDLKQYLLTPLMSRLCSPPLAPTGMYGVVIHMIAGLGVFLEGLDKLYTPRVVCRIELVSKSETGADELKTGSQSLWNYNLLCQHTLRADENAVRILSGIHLLSKYLQPVRLGRSEPDV
ncbi:hypothetical protein BABINDRAFT_166376 [Babjeviella inositovora NRRL Y-12698]|uniref:Uncharacterized protein n=1 Tax=Babjeviella inositovora NRRL Y-12698 TaxID=984486 RepID=A0A1E3QTE3_9ASCO|nr:uncharacterized protein BABINDRAFT_166376 [Babjeviella inositovora NRRL Y-12698]ODQ80794.1 hypothetical protein BABINDRAFT_166376 [Babjeviella inositovora NRRL Y-12698]